MLTAIVQTTSNHNLYSSSQIKESPAQSVAKVANNANHPNEWEWESSPMDTDRLLAHALVSTAEQLLTKLEKTDFTEIAKKLGELAYQQLNSTWESMSRSTLSELRANHPTNKNGTIGPTEWNAFKDSVDDLDGFW